VDFEFDPQKSQFNKLKHGIDFEEAQGLWNDPNAIEIEARENRETVREQQRTLDGNFHAPR
jgi:uncharacterized protein